MPRPKKRPPKKRQPKLEMHNPDFWKRHGQFGLTYLNETNPIIKEAGGEFHGSLQKVLQTKKRKKKGGKSCQKSS